MLPVPSASHAAAAPAASAPAPIASDLPERAPRFERRFECSGSCTLSGYVPSAVLARSPHEEREAPAAIWQHSLAAGARLGVPRHRGLELLGLVLSGRVNARVERSAEGGRREHGEAGVERTARTALSNDEVSLARWDAFHAPGAGLVLHALEASDVYLVLVSRAGTLGSALDEASKHPQAVRWTERAQPWRTARLSTLPPASWGHGAYHARIAFGAPNAELGASLTLLLAAPRASVPENVHPEAWEHIAILEGDGTMRQSGHAYAAKPGALFQVAQGSPHAYVGGESALAAILVFSPSGPEQRFVERARAEAP